MALSKTYVTPQGVTTNYHRVSTATLMHNGTLDCTLESFVSKDYATDGNYVTEHQFLVENVPLEEEEATGIRKLAYMKIKEHPDWNDAVDC